MATVDNLDIVISANFRNTITAFNQLNVQFNTVINNFQKVGLSSKGNLSKVSNSVKSIASSFSKATAPINKLSNEIKKVAKQVISVRTAVKGGEKLWTAIESSMDYVETLNYFNKAFEQVASKADLSSFKEMGYSSAEAYYNSFSQRAEQLTQKMTGYKVSESGMLEATGVPSLGLDPSELMNYQAMFGQMSSSMGVASETSLKLSQVLTEIGADLASVKNLNFADVWNDMASGLAGMSRTLDKYGVNIRNVNLQQKLTELGIEANISALNQNDKTLLEQLFCLTALGTLGEIWLIR